MWWCAPSLFSLAVYWYGLRAWFQADDFAWLGLHLSIHDTRSFFEAMFAPMAQGTIRPLSERGFFLLFRWMFGYDAVPFHIWALLTHFASLGLLAAITVRLTGSKLAGFLAPTLWTANSALAAGLSWTSAYNQILCAFFFLLAFHLLLLHIETGENRYWRWHWLVFVLGFGVLELNLTYAGLAVCYAFLRARPYFVKTLWLLPVSAAYTALHIWVAPKPSGVYAMHYDASVLATLWKYTVLAPGAKPEIFAAAAASWMTAGQFVILAVLLAFAGWKIWRRHALAVFLLLWFGIVLAPLLPLRDHFTEYYLTIPVIGLAILGAWAADDAWRAGVLPAIGAFAVVSIYFAMSVPSAQVIAKWHFDRGRGVRTLVWGLDRAAELHPGKAILLVGVDATLFWGGIVDKPYRLFGVERVYLVPGSEKNMEAHPELGDVSEFFISPRAAFQALQTDQAVVYAAGGPRLRNVTSVFKAISTLSWRVGFAAKVDVSEPFMDDHLVDGWYEPAAGVRWTAANCSLKLLGPSKPGETLHVMVHYPKAHLAQPVSVTARMRSGENLPVVLGTAVLTGRDDAQDVEFAIPEVFLGSPEVLVSLEVSRTVIEDGGRKLGIPVSVVAIR